MSPTPLYSTPTTPVYNVRIVIVTITSSNAFVLIHRRRLTAWYHLVVLGFHATAVPFLFHSVPMLWIVARDVTPMSAVVGSGEARNEAMASPSVVIVSVVLRQTNRIRIHLQRLKIATARKNLLDVRWKCGESTYIEEAAERLANDIFGNLLHQASSSAASNNRS